MQLIILTPVPSRRMRECKAWCQSYCTCWTVSRKRLCFCSMTFPDTATMKVVEIRVEDTKQHAFFKQSTPIIVDDLAIPMTRTKSAMVLTQFPLTFRALLSVDPLTNDYRKYPCRHSIGPIHYTGLWSMRLSNPLQAEWFWRNIMYFDFASFVDTNPS